MTSLADRVDQKSLEMQLGARRSDVELSVPGKTFLIGEYVALDGGPSICVATAPRFRLRVSAKQKADRRRVFASASPAGRWLARHRDEIAKYAIEFHDPHKGKGGMGASSAQFALLHFWNNGRFGFDSSSFDWIGLIEEFRSFAWNGEGSPPSGADLVSQICGGICCFDGRTGKAEILQWPFRNLSFTLMRTGIKVATHEHLKRTLPALHPGLREAVTMAKEGLVSGEENLLVSAIEAATILLKESGRTSAATDGLLNAIRSQLPFVRAAKGCGAMGADVIMVVHDHQHTASVETWAESKNLVICGGLADLSGGLQ